MPSCFTAPFAQILSVALACLTLASCTMHPRAANAQLGPGLHLLRVPVDQGSTASDAGTPYALFIPQGLPPASGWPVILFLHGSGERGVDGLRPCGTGLLPHVFREPQRWPAIIVAPQLPPDQRWSTRQDLALAALADSRTHAPADQRPAALTGLSNGGQGAWALAASHPRFFRCVVPVCGLAIVSAPAGNPAVADYVVTTTPQEAQAIGAALASLPVWAFHGERDDLVVPEHTRAMLRIIRDAGGTPRSTFLPDANHNAWDDAYSREDVAQFLVGANE